jgi:hypothetical protein
MLGFRRARLLVGVLGGLGFFTLAAGSARADIIAHFGSVTGTTGNFTWNYTANATSDAAVQTGDYFEIVDFKGFNGTHSQPTGWTFVSSTSGPTPGGISFNDDPAVTNLVWEYTGSSPLTGAMNLGSFTAGSSMNAITTGPMVAQSTVSDGGAAGAKIANLTSTSVPGGISPSDTAVPEPTTLALLVVGLPVVVTRAYRWRTRVARAA